MSWTVGDWARLLEIVALNLVLSGDNAIVVGMAVRKLPVAQRKVVSILGILAAIGLQIAATLTIAWLLQLPFASCLGGILLTWIAIRLLRENGGSANSVEQREINLHHSIATVVIAYLVMSLDNIMAIAAVARDHPALLVFGIFLSGALLIPGGLLVGELMMRYPILVMIGGGILGWTAGSMIVPALASLGEGLQMQIAQVGIPALVTVIVMTSTSWWPVRKPRAGLGSDPTPGL